MSNYVKSVDFAAKDALASGNPSKLVKGSEIDTEYNNIATAVATKEDAANKGVANGYAPLNSSTKIADTYVSQSSVTQHQSALALATSQITSGTFDNARISQASVTQHQAALSIATSQLTGTLSNSTVAQGNVTQHQSALSIAWSQITGTKNADQLQGYTVSGSATASSISLRDSAGDGYYRYVNLTSTASENPAVNQILVLNGSDNYVRKAGIGHVGSAISPYLSVSTGNITSGILGETRGGTGNADGLTRNIAAYTGVNKTLSTSTPSGGASGDIWYRY